MATGAYQLRLHLPFHPFDHLGSKDVGRRDTRLRRRFDWNPATYDGISLLGTGICRRRGIPPLPCRSFRSEDRTEGTSSSDSTSRQRDGGRMGLVKEDGGSRQLKRKGALYALKEMILGLSGSDYRPAGGQYRKLVEKMEELFFSVSSN